MDVVKPRRPAILHRLVDVREGEAGGLLRAFVYFFTLLYGYYLLRPLREEMGIRALTPQQAADLAGQAVACFLQQPVNEVGREEQNLGVGAHHV